jgi:hypothetical protein
LTTTSFPEIVDSVERTDEYPSYDQEEVNFYISGLFVMLAAVAQAFGTFFGSFATDYLGFTGAFVVAGAGTWGFTILYMVACGGGIEDVPVPAG